MPSEKPSAKVPSTVTTRYVFACPSTAPDAPASPSSGSAHHSTVAPSTTARIRSITKAFPSTEAAPCRSPAPRRRATTAVPPSPMSMTRAFSSVTNGMAMAVAATPAEPSAWPTNMPSTRM